MQKRRLGKTDLELTTVGLGTWAMGGPWEFAWWLLDVALNPVHLLALNILYPGTGYH